MKQSFFATHYQDWAAKQDAHNQLLDIVNQSNMLVARIGACETHHYTKKSALINQCTECGMQTLLPKPRLKRT